MGPSPAQLKMRKVRAADGKLVKLDALMDAAPLQGTYQVYVSANRHQAASWAKVEVRAVSVTLVRPREGSTAFVLDHDIREVASNVVQVREIDPPKHSKPVRWVLYTAESISTFAACLEVVESYEQRPIVEGYHQCLKTGLQVERRQYESADHLRPVIGLICVQAVACFNFATWPGGLPTPPPDNWSRRNGSRSSARCSENRDPQHGP